MVVLDSEYVYSKGSRNGQSNGAATGGKILPGRRGIEICGNKLCGCGKGLERGYRSAGCRHTSMSRVMREQMRWPAWAGKSPE